MSLYSALYAGVSGLSAQSSAMAGVADNITNINTVGYKGVSTEFRTLVTDGTSRSTYNAGGVASAPHSLISRQGLLQASSSQTDIAIDGAGFFVVKSNSAPSGDVAFTRAGSFTPDAEGYLRNTAGLYLQGWRLDAQGNYVDTGSLTQLEPVRVSELTGTAAATSRIEVRANLQSTAPLQPVPNPGDLATGAVVPEFSRSLDVYDAQGGAHRVTMGFVRTGANQWYAEIYADPASDVTQPGGVLASGPLAFNPDGSLNHAGTDPSLLNPLTVNWTNLAGSGSIDLKLGSDGGLNGLTQFGGESALISSIVDGGMLGNLASVEISKSGQVIAIFDDGTAKPVFQLPIATFINPDGLSRVSGNAFMMSAQSGGVVINQPGSLGAGEVSSGALEASNVDLAQEFTNMIRFQRAYSASSKIITTVDDMLQEVSNLKR